jgi:hypothetical protein
MTQPTEASLREAGCTDTFIREFVNCWDAGGQELCLRLLRLHRCELLEELHKAQRPLDVLDWIIRDCEENHV